MVYVEDAAIPAVVEGTTLCDATGTGDAGVFASGVWDNNARSWLQLDDEYLKPTVDAVKMAQGVIPPALIKLPINAAE